MSSTEDNRNGFGSFNSRQNSFKVSPNSKGKGTLSTKIESTKSFYGMSPLPTKQTSGLTNFNSTAGTLMLLLLMKVILLIY